MTAPLRVLLLGGTAEAFDLASALSAREGAAVVSSLAGRTENRRPVPGVARVGGFGGVEGLKHYLRANAVDVLVDATHPFAVVMAAHAAKAAAACGLPHLKLVRPAWQPEPGDLWREVDSVRQAVAVLQERRDRCVFICIGRRELPAFYDLKHLHLVARVIERPDPPPPAHVETVFDRGPFDVNGECRLMEQRRATVLVARNSGGKAAYPKIEAARRLGNLVLTIKRPPAPAVEQTDSVAGALAWIDCRSASLVRRGGGASAFGERSPYLFA